MPSASFASGFLNTLIDKQTKERDHREANTRDAINFLVSTGRVRDYNDLLPLVDSLFAGSPKGVAGRPGGGKPGGGKGQPDPHSILAQFLNPAFEMDREKQGTTGGGTIPAGGTVPTGGAPTPTPQAGTAPQGQPQQPRSLLMTEEEAQTRAEAPEIRKEIRQHGFKMEELGLQEKTRLEAEALRLSHQKGTADKQPTQNADGKWTVKVRNFEGEVIYEQPANAPKETGPLAERVRQLTAQGIAPDRASKVAAQQLSNERQTRQQQAGQRTAAYLNMSRQSLLTNTERYNEMREVFPYVLAAKEAGAEVAQMRPEVVRQALVKGSYAVVAADERLQDARAARPVNQALREERLKQMRERGATDQEIRVERLKQLRERSADLVAIRDGQKEAVKIVEQATKTARTLAGKQSSILMGLGIDDDEATIRRQLIQELSGGQDPDAIEKLATDRIEGVAPTRSGAPAAPAAPAKPTTIVTPRGQWTVTPMPAHAP